MSLYRLHSVNKIAGGKTLLDIDQLEFEGGNIYALLGANGAGKTTLLQILAFLSRPTSGDIHFMGKTVRFSEKYLQKLRREVIMVEQFPILFSGTVHSNLNFGLAIRKTAKKEREQIIDHYLDLVDMRSFKWEPAQSLSGGETQRIALARALCLSPKVFLCDEPTSNVDVENQHTIPAVLRHVNETQKTSIIFTTHDRLQAASLALHTVVIDHGRVVQTSYDNIFPCALVEENGQVYGLIHGTTKLLLPDTFPSENSGRCRIFVDPKTIEVKMQKAAQRSVNMLEGTIVQLMEEREQVRVIVKCGLLISVLMPWQQYSDLRLAINDHVWLYINPQKIRFS